MHHTDRDKDFAYTKQVIHSLIGALDTNHDGFIEKSEVDHEYMDELMETLKHHRSLRGAPPGLDGEGGAAGGAAAAAARRLPGVFGDVDADADGALSRDEFRALERLTHVGAPK